MDVGCGLPLHPSLTNLWGYFSNLPKENWHGPWSLFLSVLQGAVSIVNSPKCQSSCSYAENGRLIGPCRLSLAFLTNASLRLELRGTCPL